MDDLSRLAAEMWPLVRDVARDDCRCQFQLPSLTDASQQCVRRETDCELRFRNRPCWVTAHDAALRAAVWHRSLLTWEPRWCERSGADQVSCLSRTQSRYRGYCVELVGRAVWETRPTNAAIVPQDRLTWLQQQGSCGRARELSLGGRLSAASQA